MYGNSRLRTGDYLDGWLKNHAAAKKLEAKTETWYREVIQSHLKPAIGHIPLSRVSPQTIQDLYYELLAKPVRPWKSRSSVGRTLSRTTVRHIANLLHLAMEHAVKRGLIARNPVDQTDPPSRDTKTPTTWTPEQLQTLLEDARATAPIHVWTLYWAMAGTGMRFGELLGLRETGLDLDQGVVMIDQT